MRKTQPGKEEITYPIGQVAKMFNISAATLRLYETEGLILPEKTSGKHRIFTEVDIKRIGCIRHMIEEKGINLAGIRMMLSAIPCWEIKNCSEDDRFNCDVYTTTQTKPCWQVDVRGNICSAADCHACEVYVNTSDCVDIKSILNKYWRAHSNEPQNEQT